MGQIIRRQTPVKGGRIPRSAGLLKKIDDEVLRQARKFKVSKSFVIATALAEGLGIKIDEKYYE